MTWTCTHSIKKCFRFVLSSLLSNHINCCMYKTASGLQLKDNIQKQHIFARFSLSAFNYGTICSGTVPKNRSHGQNHI